MLFYLLRMLFYLLGVLFYFLRVWLLRVPILWEYFGVLVLVRILPCHWHRPIPRVRVAAEFAECYSLGASAVLAKFFEVCLPSLGSGDGVPDFETRGRLCSRLELIRTSGTRWPR